MWALRDRLTRSPRAPREFAEGTRPVSAHLACGAMALLIAMAAPAQSALAQGSLFERLNLDRLQFAGIGVAGGMVAPSQVKSTRVYAIQADYGEIVPRWRVVFSTTYWGSEYKEEVMRTFSDSLSKVIIDPSGDDTLDVGRITVSDIALGAEVRWTPMQHTFLRPYLGGGLATHVINAEGAAINGTFVERALDYITFGVAGVAGVELSLVRNFAIGAQARYDFLSGVRFPSIRASATYHFDASPRQVGP